MLGDLRCNPQAAAAGSSADADARPLLSRLGTPSRVRHQGSRRPPVRLGPRLAAVRTAHGDAADAGGTRRALGRRGDARHATRSSRRRRRATIDFEPASAGRAREGEAGTLRFPARCVTPHPENNTVDARWFPAAGEPAPACGAARGRAVVVLPQWNSDARRPHRPVAAAGALRRLGAAPEPALPRRPHAARAHARRLHRQLEHRADGPGVPAGGARRAARGGLAGARRASSASAFSARASARAWRC